MSNGSKNSRIEEIIEDIAHELEPVNKILAETRKRILDKYAWIEEGLNVHGEIPIGFTVDLTKVQKYIDMQIG